MLIKCIFKKRRKTSNAERNFIFAKLGIKYVIKQKKPCKKMTKK